MRIKLPIAVLIAFAVWTAGASAQQAQQPLTLRQAVELALAHNPSLRAAEDRRTSPTRR
jgi:outer membrane protein TolC